MRFWWTPVVMLLALACEREGVSTSPPGAGSGDLADKPAQTGMRSPSLSPFAGPCRIRISGDSRGEVELHYDARDRLIRAVSSTSDEHDAESDWVEEWAYDQDGRLIRHDFQSIAMASEPTMTSAAHADLTSICQVEGHDPLPAFEEWSYDASGALIGWTSTDRWGCVPKVAERYHRSGNVLVIERWERGWDAFVAAMPSSPCVDEEGRWREAAQGCELAVREALVPVWRQALVEMMEVGVGAFEPGLRAEYAADEQTVSWSTAGADASGRLTLARGGLQVALSPGACQFEWEWERDGYGFPMNEAFKRVGEDAYIRHWFYEWRGQTLARIADFDGAPETRDEEEVEEGCEEDCGEDCADDCEDPYVRAYRLSRGEVQFDGKGRISRAWRYHGGEETLFEYDYTCESARDSLANPGLALVALDEIMRGDYPHPQLFYMTFVSQPMAAPGLWGSGRGLSGDLEDRFSYAVSSCR